MKTTIEELKAIQHSKTGMIKLFGDAIGLALNSGMTFEQAEAKFLPAFQQALGYLVSQELDMEDLINDEKAA